MKKHRHAIYIFLIPLLFTSFTYADIEVEYEQLALDIVGMNFWNNDKIFCSPHQKKYTSNYPNADYLLNIASADYIVVFVHGFQPYKTGGEQTLKEMVNTWKYHIDILEEIEGDIAYCVTTWDSDYGFDDNNFTLAKFMQLLHAATTDRRIDKKEKVITYVGHSAGGNYIKYSTVQYSNTKKKFFSLLKKDTPALYENMSKKFSTSIITMATPHLGARLADSAAINSLFAQFYLPLLGEVGANLGQQLAYKANSRGAQQLKTIGNGNNSLYELNKSFARVFPKSNIAAIAGRQDTTVDLTSANPSFTRNYTLGFDHGTFLQPFQSGDLIKFLKTSYIGKIPKID